MQHQRFFRQLKPRNIWDVIVFITFIVLSHVVVNRLDNIDKSIKSKNHAKLQITDVDQCEKLSEHLAIEQWNASAYALYVIQPKNYKKTYKELVLTSGKHIIPNTISLDNDVDFELQLYKNKYVVSTKRTFTFLNENETCITIPIYHHRVIVGELLVIFDNNNESDFVQQIHSRTIEAQVIGKLIK